MTFPNDDADDAATRAELAIFTRTLENLRASLKDIDYFARSFSRMSTVQKPSWAGIILISLAVVIELFPLKTLVQSSPGFTHLMFVSGMISLALGTSLEMFFAIKRQRQLNEERTEMLKAISHTEEKAESLFSHLWGRPRAPR